MFINYPVLSRIVILILDTVVTVVSYLIAMQLRTALGFSAGIEWRYYVHLLLIIMIIWAGLLEYQEAYAGRAYRSGIYPSDYKSLRKEIIIVVRTVLVGCPIVYFVSLIINLFTSWEVPRSLLTIFAVVNIAMLSLERALVYQSVKYQERNKQNVKKVLLLGTGDVAKQFIDSIDSEIIDVIGIIGKETCNKGKELFGQQILGCYTDLPDILHSNYIDEMVIALPAKYLGDIEEVISRCDREGIPVRIVSPFFKNLISKSRTETVYGLPNIIFLPVERNDLEMAVKRLLDIIISLISLIVLFPLFAVIMVLIKLDSAGPVLYRWRILGLHKKPLVSYKFRTMVQNADEEKEKLLEYNEMSGAAFKMSNDPRVTKVGRWLRKYSLDELPQLWSVLKGDLSLVGPRPPLQSEIEQYEGWHRRKLSVKPGITCLWQTSGRNAINNFDEWMKLDLQYIDEWTLWMDIKILFNTFFTVIQGSGK